MHPNFIPIRRLLEQLGNHVVNVYHLNKQHDDFQRLGYKFLVVKPPKITYTGYTIAFGKCMDFLQHNKMNIELGHTSSITSVKCRVDTGVNDLDTTSSERLRQRQK